MSIEIKRKKGESFSSLLRRFSNKIRRSGVLRDHKDSLFIRPKQSVQMQKRSALEKKKRGEHMDYLKKIGKNK